MNDATVKSRRLPVASIKRLIVGILVMAGLSFAAISIPPRRLPVVIFLLVLAYTVWALSGRRERLEDEAMSADPRQSRIQPDEVKPELSDLKSHLDAASRDKMKSLVKRNHELLALYSLANVVGSSLELNEVLGVALEGVIRIFGAQAGEIGIIGAPEETLVRFYRADAVLTEHHGVDAPHLSGRLAAEAAKTSGPVIADAAGLNQERPSVEITPAKGIAQLAAFPIRTKTRLLGVITLALSPDHPIASRADRDLLLSVGSMIGAAIENSQLYQRLKRISDTDPITGLYNHRFILKRLNAELRRASRYRHPLSVMMLDVDGFKDLNDTFGHPFGDSALKKIALATVAACRETDFVGRYGGDEFLIVLPETRAEAARRVGDRVRTHVRNLSLIPNEREKEIRVGVTASLGLAVYPTSGKTGTELIIAADKHLYASKRAGGNRMNGQQTA